jgi:hypothetical protein
MSTSYEFKKNKYSNWYFAIIKKAKEQQRTKTDNTYYENHHIIPKSLGGTNRVLNLVLLTAKEHFIVHLLLVKMVQDPDVYRMLNAVRRFKNTVRNSNEFNILKSFLSKFSKGRLNPSYGKKWIHNVHTNEILYVHENTISEFNPSVYKVGLPFQRGGHKDTIWVNNGINETMVSVEESEHLMANGWNLGRLYKPSKSQLRKAASVRHTPDRDKEHSQKMTGRVSIVNPQTGKVKRVLPELLEEYKAKGFILSKGTKFIKRKK